MGVQAARKLAMLACVTATPLGRPVVPEVMVNDGYARLSPRGATLSLPAGSEAMPGGIVQKQHAAGYASRRGLQRASGKEQI